MKRPLDTSLAYKYFMSYRLLDGQRYDETVVPYRPARRYRKFVRNFLIKHKYLQILLTVVMCGLACLLFVPKFSTLAGLLIGLLILLSICVPEAIVLNSWWRPTHVGVSPKGVKMYWIHWFGDKVVPPIPWSKIALATIVRVRSNIGQEEWIELKSRAEDPVPILVLSLDGIAAGEHRKRLLAAIKQFMPINQIDISLQDSLNPVKLSSHTQMWLDVLATSPKRLIENELGPGNIICNGRYKVVEQLGIGGQAIAYLAEQVSTTDPKGGPRVVLKEFVLPAEASLRVSKKAFEAIERESELLSKISHPRIAALLDLFVDDQRAYMVLEHVPGKNLRKIVHESGTIGEIEVLDLALQMCDVLKHLHTLNPPVIHRDFTPDNLILAPDMGLKLIDFNVAQTYDSNVTRTVVGKHSYIPPEQFRGKASPQSDIYAFGATLHFLLTGDDPEPITVAHPKEILASVSARMDQIIAKCTAQDLQDRYQNIAELEADFTALKAQRVSA